MDLIRQLHHTDSSRDNGANISAGISCILPLPTVVYTGDEAGRVVSWLISCDGYILIMSSMSGIVSNVAERMYFGLGRVLGLPLCRKYISSWNIFSVDLFQGSLLLQRVTRVDFPFQPMTKKDFIEGCFCFKIHWAAVLESHFALLDMEFVGLVCLSGLFVCSNFTSQKISKHRQQGNLSPKIKQKYQSVSLPPVFIPQRRSQEGGCLIDKERII